MASILSRPQCVKEVANTCDTECFPDVKMTPRSDELVNDFRVKNYLLSLKYKHGCLNLTCPAWVEVTHYLGYNIAMSYLSIVRWLIIRITAVIGNAQKQSYRKLGIRPERKQAVISMQWWCLSRLCLGQPFVKIKDKKKPSRLRVTGLC